MKYAVIKTGGKQYKVSEGQTIKTEKIAIEKNKSVAFDEVLLVADEDKVSIGQPKLTVKVMGKVLNQAKAPKISILRYKAKTGYRKRKGHRQNITEVLIEKIGGEPSSKSKVKATTKK